MLTLQSQIHDSEINHTFYSCNLFHHTFFARQQSNLLAYGNMHHFIQRLGEESVDHFNAFELILILYLVEAHLYCEHNFIMDLL